MLTGDPRRWNLLAALALIAALLVVPVTGAAGQSVDFTDTDGNVHAADIEHIGNAGITRGCNPPVNDMYCPHQLVSRAQLASFLARALELPRSTTDHFNDDDGNLHEGAINAIADAGLVAGCGLELYCPERSLSRAELASVFVRAFDFPATTTDYFEDDDVSVHEANINALAAAGVTRGCSTTAANYCPFASVPRDQFASFMARSLRLAANEPPVATPGSVVTSEDAAVVIELMGTDPDGDALTFAIVSSPAEGALNGTAPTLTYTPDLGFVGSDSFTFSVSDAEFTSAPATVSIEVQNVNDAPQLDPVGDQVVDELAEISFTVTATDVDVPADDLVFTLDVVSVSAGMTLDAASGLFSWTPSEAQGPGVFPVTITVTDDGVPNLSDAETFNITVAEINLPPTLGAIGNQTAEELVELTFTAAAVDSDLPANGLTFSIDAASVTAGMTVDPVSGAFAWTPTEAQGPGTFAVTVTVTDDGSPSLTDLETFDIVVGSTNSAPVLDPVGDQAVDELVELTFTATATDGDVPADSLTFSLDATAVAAGMSIDPDSGVFSWTPAEAQGPGTYPVTITVTDDGVPNLTDTETVNVAVAEANQAPTAAAQSYDAIGNVSIDVPAVAGLLTGATDPDLPTQTLVVGSYDATTTGGGSVSDVNSTTGAFTYSPAAGFSGADTFTYTVEDTGAATSPPATVTITVDDMVWFVDGDATGANTGTLDDPFQSIADFNGAAGPAAGDGIYLAEATAAYSDGIVLADGQKLIGEGATDASLATALGISVPTYSATLPSLGGVRPTIETSDTGITLASANAVDGVNIDTTGASGVSGTSVGALNIEEMAVSSSGHSALVLNGGGPISVTIDGVVATSDSSPGISLSGLAGTTQLSGVAITTTSGVALSAVNSGSLAVVGSGNTLTTGTGAAVVLSGGTSIAGAGVTFQSISVTGGVGTAITLNTTGAGPFTVTGDGRSDTGDPTRGRTTVGASGAITPGSGGTIANTSGDAVVLTNTQGVTLANMVFSNDGLSPVRAVTATGGSGLALDNSRISGFGDDGIYVATMTDFSVTHCEIEANAKSPDSIANDEANLVLSNVSGTLTVEDTVIGDVFEDNVRITATGGSLAASFDNVEVGRTLATAGGNDGLLVQSYSPAVVDLTVVDSTFFDNRANGIQHNTHLGASGSTTVSGSVFYGETIDINVASEGIEHTFLLDGNTLRNQLGAVAHVGNGINVYLGAASDPTSKLTGTISNNTVGNPGISGSGSGSGNGIDVYATGGGTLTAAVSDNSVDAVMFGSGFSGIANALTGRLNLTLNGNEFDVAPDGPTAWSGLNLASAMGSGTMCVALNAGEVYRGGFVGAYLFTDAGTVQLHGYSGADNDALAIETFLNGAVTAVPSWLVDQLGGTITGTPTPCPTPVGGG